MLGGVGGGRELGCGFQAFVGLGADDGRHLVLAQFAAWCLGGAGAGRGLFDGRAVRVGFVDGYRFRVVQCGECDAQGAHRRLVAGAHRFGEGLAHTET